MMPISGDELQALIPQKPPFVMVDKLIATDGVKCTTSFGIFAGNLLCDNGRLNPSGMIENIAQSAALMFGYSSKTENKNASIGYIADIRNFTYTKQPGVGTEIITEVNLTHEVLDVKIISGIIRLANEEIASCTIKIFQPPKTD
jgi:predicted hotdog family 3-hydroxylacyl-ACP dehydratase